MDTDLGILQRYDRTRDPDAFAQLVVRHAAMVYAAALRVTRSAADADDVTQECFVELCRKAGQIRTSVAAWLHLTAIHRAQDLKRAGTARLRAVAEAGAPAPGADIHTDQAAWKEIAPILDEVLAELPEEQRLPLICHYLERQPHNVIAKQFGVSRPTISRRIAEGLLALRTKLKERGIASAVPEMGALLAACAFLTLPTAVKTGLFKIGLMGLGHGTAAATTMAAGSTAAVKTSASLLLALTAASVLGTAGILGWLYLKPSTRPTAAPAPIVVAPHSQARTYATVFPVAENPIADSGNWIDGATSGLDWTSVRTIPGLACGTASGNPSAHRDSTALLTGNWGPDQTVQATVHLAGDDSAWREVELRLRSSLLAHRCSGYEVNFMAANNSGVQIEIVRWNGAIGDCMVIARKNAGRGLADGDIVKATIVGKVITASINGIQVLQQTDGTWATGNPGLGFIHQGPSAANGSYGFTRFTATDGERTADPVAK